MGPRKRKRASKVIAAIASFMLVIGLVPVPSFADSQNEETPLVVGAIAEGSGALSAAGTPTDDPNDIEVASWSAMQEAAQHATSGQTIALTEDCINSGSDRGRIQVKTSVTINLNGHKLDRDLSKRYDSGHVIEVSNGATLTIVDAATGQNGRITGGFSKDGGGIYINDGATVILRGGSVTGNTATKEGGGVYVAKGGNLQLEGGAIEGNTAVEYGGGIVVYGTLTTTAGEINNNTAGDVNLNITSPLSAKGGGVYVCADGTMSMSATTVAANTAGEGGGIYVHSKHDGSIQGSSITGNKARGSYGGGIYMNAEKTTLTVENSSITSNESVAEGGGIYLYWGTIDMTGGSLSDNKAVSGGGAKITRKTAFKAHGVTMSGNRATTKEGGGIKNVGTTELTGCNITSNHAELQGGGIYNDNDGDVDASLSITNCAVSQNESSGDGGGIYSDAKNSSQAALSINGATIQQNTAGTGKGNGLHIAGDADNPQIEGKIVIDGNNKAVSKQEAYLSKNKKFVLSGALDADSKIGVTLKENVGVFTDQYAARMGESASGYGAIFFSPEDLDVISEEGEVKLACHWDELQNKIDATQDNGTVDIDRNYTYSVSSSCKALTIPEGKHLTIDLHGYTLNRNLSTWDDEGSVIVVPSSAELTIMDTGRDGVDPGTGKITGGFSKKGGGIRVETGATLNFQGGIITGNKVTDDGGGVYVAGTLAATGGLIDGNAAGEGRDDFKAPVSTYDYYTLFGVGHGGGVYVSSTGTIDLTGATITKNTARQRGGGIYTGSNASPMKISGSSITHNKARGHGGGIFTKSEADSNRIANSSIAYNEAEGHGGGIYMDTSDKSLTIYCTRIDRNRAGDDGGGIYLLQGAILMENSDQEKGSLSNNWARHDSGGIKVEEGSSFTANNVPICENKAETKEGGGIKNYGTTKLTNCTVSNNSAEKSGGGIYNSVYEDGAGDMSIDSCTITNNSTQEEGGGIYIGSQAKNTAIKGTVVVTGNTAGAGKDLYLKSGKKLTVAGQIDGTNIGDIAMEKSGVFTKGYFDNHASKTTSSDLNDDLNNPAVFFGTANGAIPVVWTDDFKEALIDSRWSDLQRKITEAESSDTHKVTLDRDYTANSSDTRLKIHEGKTVIIDLAGHTINRNLSSMTDNGHVMELLEGSNLTIEDSSPDKTGKIVGGYSKYGGGIYVGDGATLNFNGGTITRNKAAQRGGGIYVHGNATLSIGGGAVSGNKSSRSGGGIYVEGTLTTTSGVVDGNTAGIHGSLYASEATGSGGGIFMSSDSTMSLSGLTVTNNTSEYRGGGIYLVLNGNPSIDKCTIAYNGAAMQGGGIFMDEESATLKIGGSHIDGNFAVAGGGFYLRWGTIAMSGTDGQASSLSNNSANDEGGGGVVTSNTNCSLTNVNISGNTVSKMGGGGIMNAGTTMMDTCTISENNALRSGGGVENTNEGTLTLENCMVSENNSGDNGGGVYSNNKLTLVGGTISGNTASGRGAGIYVNDSAETTGIQGNLVVQDNAAAVFGNDIFLRSGKKLTLDDALGSNAKIGVDLEAGTGVITEHFRAKNPSLDPKSCFVVAKGYDLKVENGEVVLTSDWKALKNKIESAKDGDLIELTQDYAATPSDERIVIPEGKHITVDLKGYTLNRNKGGNIPMPGKEIDRNGHVFDVYGTLTLRDTSAEATGTVMGGRAVHGGGLYVHGGAALNLEGGIIAGNEASEGGGGIYVNGSGALNMSGGTIQENATYERGGGVYVAENGVLALKGGTVTANTAETRGGGIFAHGGAKIAVEGNPVVLRNDAPAAGRDVYLPANELLMVTGAFTEGARMGIAIENNYGTFTDGYDEFNSSKKPSSFFVSTQAYEVSKINGEAALGKDTYGETDYEDSFIDRNDQIKTDPDVLNGLNWMSGISGERFLNEINMPGTHDSGMYDLQELDGVAIDYTAAVSFFAYGSGAHYATTQVKYIDQQLEEGARQLDIRLNDWYKEKEWYGYDWEDDGKSLWICHGTSGFGGTYFAVDHDEHLLSFAKVLEWVTDFLERHPTETVILNIRPETPKSGHSDIIYARAREILRTKALQINPSTGEPFLYKEGGSSDFFAPYTHMPQLKDCRGKIVLLPQDGGFVDRVGGMKGGDTLFKRTPNEIAYTDPTSYKGTAAEQVVRIRQADAELNANGPKLLPDDADAKYDFLWYWELNCTGEDQGLIANYTSGVSPVMHAMRVNPGLIGDEKVFGPEKTGEYIGWVRMDALSAQYAEPIWRTNIFERQQYCTITVQSGLGGPYEDQTYQVLKGTTIEIPGNIYKDSSGSLQGKYFGDWKAVGVSSGTEWSCDEGEKFRIDEDVTFTAQWLSEGEVPVRIVWQDGDNADKLRPSSVQLSMPVTDSNAPGQAAETITLTSDDDWSTVVTGGAEGIVPVRDDSWFKPEVTGGAGQDAAGEYRYERSLEAGNGLVLTFIHTPQAKVTAAGTITWVDNNNASGDRPNTVTLHLRAKGSDDDIAGTTVSAGGNDAWQYAFGGDPHEFPQYVDGKEVEYVVVQNDVAGYSAVVDGFSVTNTLAASNPDTAEVRGVVKWDDAQNTKSLRPESITVSLLANGEERAELKVREDEYGLWTFSFGEVPVYDTGEQPKQISYSVVADGVDGYKNPPTVEGLGPYVFRITNTLNIPDEQKEQPEIASAPKPRSLTYNGEAQELVETGSTPDGTMMYALGADGEHAPELGGYSAELPTATDAGTYSVWYYVRGDALHLSTDPVPVQATVAKRPVTFSGVSDSATYTGSEIEITGVETEGLVEEHAHNVEFSAKGTDVGEHQGAFTFVGSNGLVIKSGSSDVTANYAATFEKGTLTIEGRPVPPKTKGTLTFDLGGGTINGKTSLVIEADVGDVITIPEAPIREGYTFKYWKGSEYYPGDQYKVEADHTFTAVWEKTNGGGHEENGGNGGGGSGDDGGNDGGASGASGTTKGGSSSSTAAKGSASKTGDAFGGAALSLAVVAACALCLAGIALCRLRRRASAHIENHRKQ